MTPIADMVRTMLDRGASPTTGSAKNIRDAQAVEEVLPAAATIDLLSQAVRHVRPFLHRSTPVGERIRCFWAGVFAARDLGASDVVKAEFLQLARDTGLFADLGRHAHEDLRHVVRWAMLNRNPFQ